jgi:competence protein ComFC
MDLFGLLFPKRCVCCRKTGHYLCEKCFSYLSFDVKSLCLYCDRPSYNSLTHPVCKGKYTIDGCFSAVSYNKTAKKLIYSFKYKPYIKDLRTLLSELFYESIIQKEEFMTLLAKGNWTIVPIPLSGLKLRKRGYNQAEILSFELSKRLSIPEMSLLARAKDTKSQFKLSKEKRRENIKGAFIINRKQTINNHNILLVDDVVTSGATLLEAANILKRNGAKKVIGLTLARD